MTTKTYPAQFVLDVNNTLLGVFASANHYATLRSYTNGQGICQLVENRIPALSPDFVFEAIHVWVRETIARWPDHSGYRYYPVSAPRNFAPGELRRHEDAFYSLHKWDRATEYGRSRWSLLAFLLEEASKMKVQ